ncbi:MAG TPA: phosphatase PAP2/dual specificity phosphatase family protein [Thermoanaerobaculia bacterium]|nr:phosphatase PAP2/dual specificity phosphatase family protein [Thermoanaerobaculia bacterium]
MKRPWKRAAAWLAFLGPFFFASYGFANWLASTRADVGVVAFAWERHIPFVPWTIVPYWSIDLLYAISFFVCTTRREVDRHGQRLLFAQLVSIACFIAFPLRFSFERPQSDGVFGALFTALTSFDKPFNQAPSLHIALLIVVWVRFAAHLRRMRWLFHGWMALIGVSILTTYQHHFIDLPTGAAVGFLALWILPDEEESPLRRLSFTRDRRRRRLALFYAAGAALCTAVASLGGAWLWMCWPAASLAIVALIYAAVGERGFQKSSSGRLSLGARALLAPYLGAAWLNSRLWTRNHPGAAEVRDGVWIGRIPTSGEPFAAIVDLCAELSCAEHPAYRNVPVLDLTVPNADALRTAAQAIESAPKPLLVCCALGYSRSARAVVEWLLTTRRAASFDEAAAMVRKARPSIVLHHD